MSEPKDPKNSEQFLTLAEVQEYLGIKSRKTVLKYIASGKLKAYKIGGTRWRIALDDVHAFLKHQIISIPDVTSSEGSSATVKP